MGRKSKETPKSMEEWNDWLSRVQRADDVGGALVGVALLERQLEDLLRNFFVDAPKWATEMLSATGNGPLGTYGARIRIAYLLGFLSEEEFRDLRLIGKIRNAFAHSFDKISFDKGEVRNWCRELKTDLWVYPYAQERDEEPRRIFSVSVFLLTARLNGRIMQVPEDRRKPPVLQDVKPY
jgi:DNA-binding MltR family transcriptional regulator